MWRGEKVAGPWQTIRLFFPAGATRARSRRPAAAPLGVPGHRCKRGGSRGRSDISSGDRANGAQLQPVRRAGRIAPWPRTATGTTAWAKCRHSAGPAPAIAGGPATRGGSDLAPVGSGLRVRGQIAQAGGPAVRLLFVDDSGSPTPRRAHWDVGVHILAGVAVDDRDMASVAGAAIAAKEAVGLNMGGGGWEIRAHDVWNNAGPFGGKDAMLSMRQKRDIFSSMVNVIDSPRVGFIPVVVDKRGHKGRQGWRRPLEVGWSAMFRRFECELRQSDGEYGLILADSGRGADEEAARLVVERMGRSRMGQTAGHVGVVNGVIHRDSGLDIMIQLADVAAYIIHRHYRGSPHFRHWFEAIRTRFDTDPAALGV